ncbi:hypothetical protein JW796_03560 [Candidatus Dojkabacteria bacterium]|nr:hypothetical protein [Candidatus Dojkabacteria bacterium]
MGTVNLESLFREGDNQEGAFLTIENFKGLDSHDMAYIKEALLEGNVFLTYVERSDYNNKLLGTTQDFIKEQGIKRITSGTGDDKEPLPLCYLQVREDKHGRQKNELIFCEGNNRVALAIIHGTSIEVGIIGVIDRKESTFTYWKGNEISVPTPILGFNAVFSKARSAVTSCSSAGQSLV